jgi:MYXO-CTERM domain-containing protein
MKRLLSVSLLALLSAAMLAAQTIAISNLNQTSTYGLAVGRSDPPDIWSNAASFTVGSDAATLSKVTFAFKTAVGSPTGFTLALYSTVTSTGPNVLVTSLSGNTTPSAITFGTTANVDYTPAVAVQLQASTTYWLVASAPDIVSSINYFDLVGADSGGEDAGGLAGWSIGDSRMYSADGGTTWFSTGIIPEFAVTIAAVPELSTSAAALGVAALGAALRLRRRRSVV